MRKILPALMILITIHASAQGDTDGIKKLVDPCHSSKIIIRCATPVMEDQYPLIVVNGIRFEKESLKSINPDDILSINILKGADASVLFGGAGVNGVIIITTKSSLKKQLLIQDEHDRSPIAGASVMLIKGRDTVLQIANTNGFVSFDRKLFQHEYKIEISSIGYEKKTAWISNLSDSTIPLKRKIDQMDSVVVRSYNCTRRISCGGKCFSIINNKGMTREEVSLKSYSVYPNPARPGTSIQIKLFTSFSGKIQLFNMAGQEIHSAFLKTVKMGIINYILPSVPSGNYIIRLTDHNLLSAFSEKIIVQ